MRTTLAIRNGNKCVSCNKSGIDYQLQVDHIIPLVVGRGQPAYKRRKLFLTNNLQLLCSECHVKKTTEDQRKLKVKK